MSATGRVLSVTPSPISDVGPARDVQDANGDHAEWWRERDGFGAAKFQTETRVAL